jgi:hypothetical protein
VLLLCARLLAIYFEPHAFQIDPVDEVIPVGVAVCGVLNLLDDTVDAFEKTVGVLVLYRVYHLFFVFLERFDGLIHSVSKRVVTVQCLFQCFRIALSNGSQYRLSMAI